MIDRYSDGTGRGARQIQVEAIDFIHDNIDNNFIVGIQGPPATGKSFIAKALAKALPNTDIVVPNNLLLNQYINQYHDMNSLKGIAHYHCNKNHLSCQEVKIAKIEPCNNCPYQTCKNLALSGEATIFNPISLFYLQNNRDYDPDDKRILIVDEAHKLFDMLKLTCSIEFSSKEHVWTDDDIKDIDSLAEYLNQEKDNFMALFEALKESEPKKSIKYLRKHYSIKNTIRLLKDCDYLYYTEKRWSKGIQYEYLVVKPLEVPKDIVLSFFRYAKRVILLSATLPKSLCKSFNDMLVEDNKESFAWLDLRSVIPVKNRKIYFDRESFFTHRDLEINDLCRWIVKWYEAKGKPNTIVHLSYALSKQVKEVLPYALSHTSDNKQQVLDHFLKHGGLFLACGLAEGLDLPNDLCRLNLIPFLPYPHLKSPETVGMKRKYGNSWYQLACIQTLLQQIGRATRHENDFSEVIIGNMRGLSMLRKHWNKLPRSLTEDGVINGI